LIGEIRKFHTFDELSASVAEDIDSLINRVVCSKGIFYLALSGGNTPRTLYRILGTTYREAIPWGSVHIFFCDERFVSHEDSQSNFRMTKENLLDLISIPQENIHSIPTDRSDIKVAARDYEIELRKFFSGGVNSFDLAILGIGREGHTASLFPGSPALDEKEKWVLGVEVDALPPRRITLTYPILNRSSVIYLIVSGSGKAEIMREILKGVNDFHVCPASGIRPLNGRLVWQIDFPALPNETRK
jgi:6-phosphogluconolactonase